MIYHKLLDHGYISFVEGWGSDKSIVEAALSNYWKAIPLAIEQGYIVDVDAGTIHSPYGRKLSCKLYAGQTYPIARLFVKGLPRKDYSVPVHKIMAFKIYGWEAFLPGVEVRHKDGNPANNVRSNLLIGTSSQNQMDKRPEVRSLAARTARSAQPFRSFNAILTEEIAEAILTILNDNRTVSGRIKRGVVKSLSRKHKVSPSTISLIGKGTTWQK